METLFAFFILLSLLLCAHGSDAMDDGVPEWTNVLRLHGMDGDNMDDNDAQEGIHDSETHVMDDRQGKHHHAHPSSHMDHIDPSVLVFFTLKDLKVGKTMSIYFSKTDPSSSLHFLPKEEPDSIPFSLAEPPNLVQFFSFSQGSPQARAMEDTPREYASPSWKKPNSVLAPWNPCLISLAASLEWRPINVLITTHLTKSTTLLQNFTILKAPKEMSAPKMVACHTMPCAYAIAKRVKTRCSRFCCVAKMETVEAVAVCHLDTSQ